jgi:cardiolipin synthase
MGAPAGARRNARPDEIVYSESELFQRRLRRLAGANISDGNHIRLLKDGRQAYPEMLRLIREARFSVVMEQYQFWPDAVGHEFMDALAGAARRGVEVRVIIDRFGSWRLKARHVRPMIDAGVRLRWFNPPGLRRRWFGLLPRDHRKLLVADGAVAVTGGIGIADVWSDRARPGKQPWRDNAVRIDGRAVRDLVETFEAMWARSGRRSWRKWDIIDDLTPHGVVNGEDAIVGVVKGVPGHWTIERSSQVLAVTARERIWIWDAYFVPSPPETDALIMAARDGVDVRLLVPSRSDPAWVRPLTRRFFRKLTQGGVRVFEWQSEMMHAKTTVTDGRWVRVGSTDFNPLGVAINFELDAVILDEALGAELEEAFLQDLKNCREVRAADLRKR